MTDTSDFADGCAWIDGRYVPIADARIPILDAGFVRSDCTYDVAAVWKGRFFRLNDHIERLLAGCARIRLALPVAKEEIGSIMVETVRLSGLRDAYVEVVVTRGIPNPGERDSRLWSPRLYAYAIPYVWIVRPEIQDSGAVNVVVARNTRRIPVGAPVANLDGQPVGEGRTGPVTSRIRQRYWELHQDPTLSFAVDYNMLGDANRTRQSTC